MHSSFALAALAAVAYASPFPQGVVENVAPTASAPSGRSASYSGKFQIAAVNVTSSSKRDLQTRTTCDAPGSLTLTLAGGKLTDGLSRVGYIASNYQFQFDAPPQAGTIYNAGFSSCSNGTLALGGSAIFYQCLSGNFYNLYDRHWAAQCNPIYLQILPCSGGPAPSNGVGQVPDGQPTGTAVGAPVTQISDGQIQASTGIAAPVTQIGDGQIQVPTSVAAPITQIGDGQVQAPTGKPTVAPITQIGDGQVQAPTGQASVAPITQIGDGQIQAPTGSPSPAPTQAPITQISDGQVQAPAGTGLPMPVNTTSSRLPFNGDAGKTMVGSGLTGLVLAVVGALLL